MDDLKLVRAIANSLKQDREPFEAHYAQLEQHFLPRRGQFTNDPAGKGNSDRGGLINGKMVDSTPVRALRILQSGLQAGMTSPARPWFRLQPLDPGLRERKAVKEYIAKAEYEMRRLMDNSGLYKVLHTGYQHLGVYGTECAIIEDTLDYGLRGIELTPGSYWLGMSDERTVDTLYREFEMTVQQIVGKFVFRNSKYNEPEWGRVPQRVKNLYDKGNVTDRLTVCHLITPRQDRDHRFKDASNKPIASWYWLKEDDRPRTAQTLAGDLGYDKNPISASRWTVSGYETYGISPGMETLPDVKELMAKRRDLAEAIKRMNRPAMNAHTDLRNSRFSLLPGAVNFMDDPAKGLIPAFQANPDIGSLQRDIEISKDAVWSGMYADLFLMISNMPGVQPRNELELMERKEEKLIALGPVLEGLHNEKLKPLVERLYETVTSSGTLGPAPEELDGQELEIDFVSMLAQAQKAISTGSMERFAAFVGNISAVKPNVLDKFDEDQAVDEYADMIGVPPSIVRSDDEVDALRQQRQQAQQAAQAAEQAVQVTKAAQQGAQAAKVLSEADAPRGPAPLDILNRIGVGQ